MTYNDEFFDFYLDRYGTKNIKWETTSKRLGTKDIVPRCVADMDFRSPIEVSEALQKRASHASYGYTFFPDEGMNAFIDYYKRHHDVEIHSDETILMPSVVTGIKLAVRSISDVGDKIIIQTPVYDPFRSSIELNDRIVLENRLIPDENNRYSMDMENLESLFKNGAKLMLLCNPHNPVSRFWNEDELTRLLELAKKYDVTVVSDEIHADFIYKPNKFVSMLNIAKKVNYNNLIVLYAPSKTFNVAGMRFSMMVSRNSQFIEKIKKEMERCGLVSGNIFGLESAIACYTYGDKWLKGLIEYLDKSREILKAELSKIKNIKLSPIEATYLAWADLREYSYSTEELIERTEKHGVIFTPGTFFSKDLGKKFLRINFACPHKQLIEGINRLKESLE